MEGKFYRCSVGQFNGFAAGSRRRWIRTTTVPIHLRLLNLIHSCRRWVDPPGFDMVPIRLKLYNQKLIASVDGCITYSEQKWVSERRFQVPLSDFQVLSKREDYSRIVAGYLKSLRVPEDEQDGLITRLFQVIELAVPELPITLRIVHLTMQVPIDAMPSLLEGLEILKVDSLEEANTRHTPCIICKEDLDHFGGSHNDEQTIIRLPCLHLYHGDCILPWLFRCQVCPLCRYSISPVRVDFSPAKCSSGSRWPMLLMMSAGGIITARLICRLLKRA